MFLDDLRLVFDEHFPFGDARSSRHQLSLSFDCCLWRNFRGRLAAALLIQLFEQPTYADSLLIKYKIRRESQTS